jgi:hypothetical protein
VGPNVANVASTDSPWPKTNIKRIPCMISRQGGRETWNTPNGYVECEDRRGDTIKAALGCPSNSSTPSPSAPWWRGSSSPLGLWDCGSNLYQTLSRASLIRVTWPAYHDCYPYGGSYVCEMIYLMQRCLCSWCMSRCICYAILMCLFLSN